MKRLLWKISSLLEDDSGDGAWSTTRFAFLFTVLISNLVIFSVWIGICFIRRDIVAIPNEIITIYSLANGITATSKIIQKKFETKVDEEKKSEPVGDA